MNDIRNAADSADKQLTGLPAEDGFSAE